MHTLKNAPGAPKTAQKFPQYFWAQSIDFNIQWSKTIFEEQEFGSSRR